MLSPPGGDANQKTSFYRAFSHPGLDPAIHRLEESSLFFEGHGTVVMILITMVPFGSMSQCVDLG